MIIYPYSTPIILNDSIYEELGGNLDTTTPIIRKHAYLIAEMAASDDLSTYLLPTIVTGTYQYVPTRGAIVLDHTYINSVKVVRFIDTEEDCYWAQTGTANVYVSLRNDERGLVDIHYLVGNCNCHSNAIPYPYQIQIIYQAGLPTGTANQSDILLGMVTYANIILNEIIGYGNESPGDIGVQSFRNIQYAENRVALLKTTFGSSARAQFASRLINRYKRRQYVGL